jgi:glutamine cyclotransferase
MRAPTLRNFLSSLALCAALFTAACRGDAAAPVYGYKVVARYPHSTGSYTEGFFYLNGLFYEGTGLEGHSQILITEPATGKLIHHVDIPPQYFGEGIIDWGPNLLEWTWQTHIGFVIDRATLRTISQFHYDGEGWGMTRTPTEIITSDGTSTLRFRNPTTFAETRNILVHDGPTLIEQLNELEYIPAHGSQKEAEIYANIWHSERIARISPYDGHVIAWIDLTGILPVSQKIDAESVLNGIAYDAKRDRLFVTGKQWPTIFEIKPIPRPSEKSGPKN